MKTLWSGLIVAGLLVLTGCNTSPTGGGNTSPAGPQGKSTTFTLKGPQNVTGHTVKHKSSEDFKVTVDRGKDFKEDIAFTVAVDPAGKGVTATVDPAELKASAPGEVHVKVAVDDKAPQGNYKVTVTAKPATGATTSDSWEVKVPKPE